MPFLRLLWSGLKSRRGKSLLLGILFFLLTCCIWWMTPVRPRVTLSLPGDYSLLLQFSPDSHSLMTGEETFPCKGPIHVWDVEQGNKRFSLGSEAVRIDQVSFSPDGKVLAVHEQDGGVKLWNVLTGNELTTLQPRFKSRNWGRFEFSPDGRFLAIFDHDQWPRNDKIRLWDIAAQRDQGFLDGFDSAFSFSSDGKRAASLTEDFDGNGKKATRIMLWQVGGDKGPTLTGDHRFYGEAVTFSPTLDRIALIVRSRNSAEVKVWDMPAFAKRCSIPYESEIPTHPCSSLRRMARNCLSLACTRQHFGMCHRS